MKLVRKNRKIAMSECTHNGFPWPVRKFLRLGCSWLEKAYIILELREEAGALVEAD